MKKAFSLVEVLLAVTLISVIAILSTRNFLNFDTINIYTKSIKLQSDITLITTMIIDCKDTSLSFPKNIDNSPAYENLLRDLECKSDVPYMLDGGKVGFIPQLGSGFSDWFASEVGGSFYIFASAQKNTNHSQILKTLYNSYPKNQVMYDTNSSTTEDIFRFYIYK